MKNKWIITISLILVLCTSPLLSGCGGSDSNKTGGSEQEHEDQAGEHSEEEGHIKLSPEALKTLSLETAPVELRNLGGEITTTAVIEPDQTRIAHVSPRIPGRAIEVKAFLGDRVTKGQILAELDSIELGQAKADYLKARANLQVARANYQREDRLYKKQISSEKEYLDAKGEFLRSEAEMNSSRETLRLLGLTDKEIDNLSWGSGKHPPSHFPLLAPFDGTVTEQHIVQGELIKPEDKPYTLADLSHLWIQLDIYEKDLGWVNTGKEVAIKVDSYPDAHFNGKLKYISDMLDESTRTAKARVELNNPDRKLKPGMFATAIISTPSAGTKEVISIPSSAIQQIRGKTSAFVAENENSFELRELELGNESGNFVEVLKGLTPGEKVVTTGGFYLKSLLLKEEMGEEHAH
ncbi:MAG: efflux RND transporter periplasmic adaptor subunit [Deltaproteobacteria bacterium]